MSSIPPRNFAESFGKLHRVADKDLQDRMKPAGTKKPLGKKSAEELYLTFCTDLAFSVRDLLATEFGIQNVEARGLAIELYRIYQTEQSMENLRNAEQCRQEVSTILNLTRLG